MKIGGIHGQKAESILNFCLITHLLYDGNFPINYEGLAYRQIGWKKVSIAAVVAKVDLSSLPADVHVLRFLEIFADSQQDCVDALRFLIDTKIGRYTNDIVAEFGQIFHRGKGSSIEFAVSVLAELADKSEEYKVIIAKWLDEYKGKKGKGGYKRIVQHGGLSHVL